MSDPLDWLRQVFERAAADPVIALQVALTVAQAALALLALWLLHRASRLVALARAEHAAVTATQTREDTTRRSKTAARRRILRDLVDGFTAALAERR
jgi:hypothetical protein